MNLKKWIPLFLIGVLMLAAYFLGISDYLNFETLKANRDKLLKLTSEHSILSPAFFVLFYIVTVALSMPWAAILSLIGGFLFGAAFGTFYVVIAATIGALLIFLAARTAFGEILKKKAGPFLSKMETGFQKNAALYLLSLRFIPLFPFWVVNLAPAFFHVPLWIYIWTTFVGIIPGSYVYVQAGSGLAAVFDSGETFSFDSIFNIQIKIALILLALFTLAPIFVKFLVQKRKGSKNQ